MSTGCILSILAYPQYGYHLVYHTGLSLVHCSYLSVGSLQWVGQPCAGQSARERSERLTVVLWLYIIAPNSSEKYPILITNNSGENLLSEAFRLNNINFYRLILLSIIFIFILILTHYTLSLRCSRNLRIPLPTECPHYTIEWLPFEDRSSYQVPQLH